MASFTIDTRWKSEEISDDLLAKILSRIPTKPLLRFKCVSKAWYSLISQVTSRTRQPSSMSGLFYHESYIFDIYCSDQLRKHKFARLPDEIGGLDEITDTSLCFVPPYPNFRIVDSCKGLILCHPEPKCSEELYYVCNPVTKRWAELPMRHEREGSIFAAYLAFDPNVSPYYSVICIVNSEFTEPTCIELKIFSSEKGEWSESMMFQQPGDYYLQTQGRRAIFINGTLFMVLNSNQIVGFDEAKRNSLVIDLPGDDKISHFDECLGECKGYLHYAEQTDCHLAIWVLKDLHMKEWVLKHNINNGALVEMCPESDESFNPFNPLAFHPDFEVIFLGIAGKILCYHLNSERLEEVCNLSTEDTLVDWTRVYPFSPCPFLDPLDNNHEC